MRRELQYFIYVFLLGAGLIVYAHNSFATKERVKTISETLKTIDQRVYEIHSKVVK